MLETYFIPNAQGLSTVHEYWYQQDGARPHRTQEVFDVVKEHFGGRIIALDAFRFTGDGIDWPPYSPDLNPCDFFLWGYLKDNVYRCAPRTLDDLKNSISEFISKIEREMVLKVMQGFENRLRNIVISEGSHFENLVS